MRKISKKEITRIVECIDAYICNKCEKQIDNDTIFLGNIFHPTYMGGYGSILGDMSEYSFDICEQCLSEWFKTFKVDPLVIDKTSDLDSWK